MCLKNKIIASLMGLALLAAIVPFAAKAMTQDEITAQINDVTQQIAQLQQQLAAMTTSQTTTQAATQATTNIVLSGKVTDANGKTVTYSDPSYVNPASCPAPTNVGCSDPAGDSMVAIWAKNPANGDCCQYSPKCQSKNVPSNWTGIFSKEGCQAAPATCAISGNNCVQNGKSYPLTNTCTNGATPYILQCNTYADHCEPVIRCSMSHTVVAANCSQECKNRGFADGSCIGSAWIESVLHTNYYDNDQNIIGWTTDCSKMDALGVDSYPYCGCTLAREDNVPFGQSGWLGIDSMCDALCRNAGDTMGKCLVRADNAKMECSDVTVGANPIYLGTTNVCKSGANFSAGCCCARMGDPNDPANDGGGHPIAGGSLIKPVPSVNPVTKKADGATCAAAGDCSSNICLSGYCGLKPNTWACGANSECASNSCVSGKCGDLSTATMTTTAKANGQQCAYNSECVSSVCNCGYCVPGSTYCGGVANPLYWASGSSSANQWLTGYCNNGAWQTAANGYGCANAQSSVCGYSSFACVSGYTCDTTQNNGQGGNGKCVSSTCTNQCTSGAKQCSGNGVQTCVSSSSCLTWSAAVACSSGQTCSNGNCVANSTTSATQSISQSVPSSIIDGGWQIPANGYGCANISSAVLPGYSSVACANGYTCDTTQNNGQGGNGKCVASTCAPNCSGKSCGDNGCGGSCGSCASGQTCSNGACVSNSSTVARAAQFVSQSVPSSMTAGQTYSVSITMQNAGTATWTAATNYKLGAQNPQDNGTWTGNDRVLLSAGESVAPGQSKTFTFNVTAPTAAGTYNFQWQMVQENVAWFGDKTTNVAVTVGKNSTCTPNCSGKSCGDDGCGGTCGSCSSGQTCGYGTCVSNTIARAAQFVSQSVPSSMTAGQTYPVSIIMKNTGTATWTAATNYKLGAQNPQDNGTWTGNDRVLLSAGESVAPGQSKTFTFNVTAPTTVGTYNYQWQMLQEKITWFGDKTTNVAVTVGAKTSSIDSTNGFLATLAQIQNEIASISYALNQLTVSK